MIAQKIQLTDLYIGHNEHLSRWLYCFFAMSAFLCLNAGFFTSTHYVYDKSYHGSNYHLPIGIVHCRRGQYDLDDTPTLTTKQTDLHNTTSPPSPPASHYIGSSNLISLAIPS